MTKLSAVLSAVAILAASSVYADSTAPVAVTQADTFGGLNTATTWTAAGIVVVGAAIIENADGDDADSDTTGTTE
jgi:hypothetical protein